MKRAVCARCLRPVMLLRTPEGPRVAVDPEPLRGGSMLVNGAAGRVVGYKPRSGTGSAEMGWRRHEESCPGVLVPHRPLAMATR